MERILVLDDDSAIRDSLLLFFEDREMETVAATSVTDAFDVLSRCPCDVAIVDLRLPGETGEEFVMEAHLQYPRMRFIIHTGSSDYRITPQLVSAGVREQDVFIKPVSDLERLADKARELRARAD